MRVEWNEAHCSLTGLCSALAPDVFVINDAAEMEIVGADTAPQDLLRQVADSCPTQAITIHDQHDDQEKP